MYKIPLFDLNYDENEIRAVTETISSKWISSGPKCRELEEKFCEALQISYACAVSNCTAALHLALCALGIGKGDEVIVPSLTFVATVNAVKYVGADPVFCDIVSPMDITIDETKFESLITPKTRAVIVMHYAGFACHMQKIMEIARKHHLYIVEDACHAPLSEYQGKKLGTLGDVGCFSFFSNKNISTGEGGMLVTDNPEIDKRVKLMRSHGMTAMSYERSKGHSASYDVAELGFNYRMDDIRASLGIVQLEKLAFDLKKRERIREWYLENLKELDGVWMPFADYHEFSSNYIMPVVLKNADHIKRDAVRELLQKQGIQTSVHYPAVHRFSVYQDLAHGELLNSEYVADCEITFPMYGKLEKSDVMFICNAFRQILEELQ